MISIDRDSTTPLQEQLVEQLRYRIVSGALRMDELLPSTRALAEQLGISFHTVRKAYQQLEQEGLLASKAGSGYRVRERVPLGKGERMERGAGIMHDMLQRLIGLGLEEAEIEYLMHEQFSLLEGTPESVKLVLAAPYREMADLCAEQVAAALQQSVESTTLAHLDRHQDADYIITPYEDMRPVMEQATRADVLGIVTYLTPETLERIVRLLNSQTLGIVTRYADAIQPLMNAVRTATGFSGQMIAASIDESARHLSPFIDQTDLIVYTPSSRRGLLPLLRPEHQHASITPVVSRDSLENLRQRVPV